MMNKSMNTISTLVFDWGNTLMRVFPDQTGPMVAWSKIAAVESAHEMLSRVHGKYQLILATNAADSTAVQVQKALERVGLDQYGFKIFTSHELVSRKPDIQFFQTIEELLHIEPQNVLMVGDDYRSDIFGAMQAGWRTAWFNNAYQPAPGHFPQCNAEIYTLDELPTAIDHLAALPDYPTCLLWLQRYHVSLGLFQHVSLVAAIAYQLALWLRARGQIVSPLLAHRGGLLHDLTKLAKDAFPDELDHGATAAQVLSEFGYPQLAEIALRHPLFCLTDPERRPLGWEQKIVHLADKLAEGISLVTVDHRLTSLASRYPQHADRIASITPAVFDLQAEICDLLGWQPQSLPDRLQEAIYKK
jgi:putative hydrolase of the HAD superfamily